MSRSIFGSPTFLPPRHRPALHLSPPPPRGGCEAEVQALLAAYALAPAAASLPPALAREACFADWLRRDAAEALGGGPDAPLGGCALAALGTGAGFGRCSGGRGGEGALLLMPSGALSRRIAACYCSADATAAEATLVPLLEIDVGTRLRQLCVQDIAGLLPVDLDDVEGDGTAATSGRFCHAVAARCHSHISVFLLVAEKVRLPPLSGGGVYGSSVVLRAMTVDALRFGPGDRPAHCAWRPLSNGDVGASAAITGEVQLFIVTERGAVYSWTAAVSRTSKVAEAATARMSTTAEPDVGALRHKASPRKATAGVNSGDETFVNKERRALYVKKGVRKRPRTGDSQLNLTEPGAFFLQPRHYVMIDGGLESGRSGDLSALSEVDACRFPGASLLSRRSAVERLFGLRLVDGSGMHAATTDSSWQLADGALLRATVLRCGFYEGGPSAVRCLWSSDYESIRRLSLPPQACDGAGTVLFCVRDFAPPASWREQFGGGVCDSTSASSLAQLDGLIVAAEAVGEAEIDFADAVASEQSDAQVWLPGAARLILRRVLVLATRSRLFLLDLAAPISPLLQVVHPFAELPPRLLFVEVADVRGLPDFSARLRLRIYATGAGRTACAEVDLVGCSGPSLAAPSPGPIVARLVAPAFLLERSPLLPLAASLTGISMVRLGANSQGSRPRLQLLMHSVSCGGILATAVAESPIHKSAAFCAPTPRLAWGQAQDSLLMAPSAESLPPPVLQASFLGPLPRTDGTGLAERLEADEVCESSLPVGSAALHGRASAPAPVITAIVSVPLPQRRCQPSGLPTFFDANFQSACRAADDEALFQGSALSLPHAEREASALAAATFPALALRADAGSAPPHAGLSSDTRRRQKQDKLFRLAAADASFTEHLGSLLSSGDKAPEADDFNQIEVENCAHGLQFVDLYDLLGLARAGEAGSTLGVGRFQQRRQTARLLRRLVEASQNAPARPLSWDARAALLVRAPCFRLARGPLGPAMSIWTEHTARMAFDKLQAQPPFNSSLELARKARESLNTLLVCGFGTPHEGSSTGSAVGGLAEAFELVWEGPPMTLRSLGLAVREQRVDAPYISDRSLALALASESRVLSLRLRLQIPPSPPGPASTCLPCAAQSPSGPSWDERVDPSPALRYVLGLQPGRFEAVVAEPRISSKAGGAADLLWAGVARVEMTASEVQGLYGAEHRTILLRKRSRRQHQPSECDALPPPLGLENEPAPPTELVKQGLHFAPFRPGIRWTVSTRSDLSAAYWARRRAPSDLATASLAPHVEAAVRNALRAFCPGIDGGSDRLRWPLPLSLRKEQGGEAEAAFPPHPLAPAQRLVVLGSFLTQFGAVLAASEARAFGLVRAPGIGSASVRGSPPPSITSSSLPSVAFTSSAAHRVLCNCHLPLDEGGAELPCLLPACLLPHCLVYLSAAGSGPRSEATDEERTAPIARAFGPAARDTAQPHESRFVEKVFVPSRGVGEEGEGESSVDDDEDAVHHEEDEAAASQLMESLGLGRGSYSQPLHGSVGERGDDDVDDGVDAEWGLGPSRPRGAAKSSPSSGTAAQSWRSQFELWPVSAARFATGDLSEAELWGGFGAAADREAWSHAERALSTNTRRVFAVQPFDKSIGAGSCLVESLRRSWEDSAQALCPRASEPRPSIGIHGFSQQSSQAFPLPLSQASQSSRLRAPTIRASQRVVTFA